MAERDELLSRLAASSRDQPVAVGRYDVIGRIGQGGMGTVYDAIDRTRGSRVALKTLSTTDVAAGVRLKREFRVVADMSHPNLAPMYELAHEDGLWFFTMEHVEGVDFARWARGTSSNSAALPMTRAPDSPTETPTRPARNRAPQEPTTKPIGDRVIGEPAWHAMAAAPACGIDALRAALAELTRGLSALHDAGLWHGDVKQQNVLVRDDGHVVVVDFGLAEPVGAARGDSTGGTPIFMAPEQHAGVGVGPASDWYAVGTMLYQTLTGRDPFDADSLLDLYFKKTQQTPIAPRDLVAEIPSDLSEVCLALLQPAPERRPTGHELLRVFAGDDEVRAQVSARAVRAPFVGRRHELRVLEQAYATTRQDQLVVVHAHGPSGIGKSAVLRSFGRGVQDVGGAYWLRGRCYERESVPYNAFDGVVDELAERLATMDDARIERLVPEWIGELVQVFPALAAVPRIADRIGEPNRSVKAVELRRRAFAALRQLFAMLARERPIVLSIDDLQWADADSARLLDFIVEELADTRMLVIASYRPAEAEANPALREYFATRKRPGARWHAIDLPLGPLAAADAEILARSRLRDLGEPATEARLRRLTDEAGGIPFFIEELARYVAGRDATLDGTVSLDDAIAARVRVLPADQRALIEIVAMADSPLPQSLVFEASGLSAGALPALLALRSASLVDWRGAGADDPVATYHDRIRESVIARLDEDSRRARHLALGRAFAVRHATQPLGSSLFEAVRHLAAAGPLLADPAERLATARLALVAGERARHAAAFPLAFACFERGIATLAADAWASDYDLALGLHAGAAETAYLAAEWTAMDQRCADVKAHARTALDQLVAWEVEIDARIGRHQYVAAVEVGMAALALLHVELPRDPGMAEVGIAFQATLAELERVGPEGLAAMPDVADPSVAAAMRIQIRVSPAAYFARPLLLPILACNLVRTSIARGLSTATPYALALFGIVLNTAGMHPVAHVWGQLAVKLIDRWPDRRLEAATRHVVFDLVCSWMVPLSTILAPLREVWTIGKRIGDLEYASYAAHGYVHNAMYAGRPLGPLLDEALALGAEMRALGQVNAIHVHEPFEQLLKALTGKLPHAPSLDDDTFNETVRLATAAADGSRSGIFVLRVAMGLSRFYLGEPREASAQFEHARAYLDAAPSVWHVPILHQFAALAACSILDTASEAERATLHEKIAASLDALRALAAHAPINFAHRVSLVEAELARVSGDVNGALGRLEIAVQQAHRGGWQNDVALAHELAALCHGQHGACLPELAAARDGYAAWGAAAKAAQLATRSGIFSAR